LFPSSLLPIKNKYRLIPFIYDTLALVPKLQLGNPFARGSSGFPSIP
jgi:hypothetical protein